MTTRVHATALLILLICTGSAGCDCVYASSPIGEVIDLDPDHWDGSWFGTEEVLQFRVSQDEPGLLLVHDPDNPGDTLRINIRKVGDQMFANLQETEEGGLYLWWRVEHQRDVILLWLPRTEALADLIRTGELPGHVEENGSATLGDLTEADLTFLAAPDAAHLYEWEEPAVFVRIPLRLAPCLREEPQSLVPETQGPPSPGEDDQGAKSRDTSGAEEVPRQEAPGR